MNVSILIVNYNGSHLLTDCLNGLRQQVYPPYQVLVVDNASHDGSRALLEAYAETWSVLKLLFLDRNTGFSGGNNAGLPLLDGELVALLNTDALVDSEWISSVLPAFADPTVGMVACKTLRFEDETVFDKVGHLIYPDGLNRGRATGLVDVGQFEQTDEALWPDGSAGFYRKAMLDEIGFLDPDFFLYGEDAELGMRARWAGWRCIYEPRSRVRHHQSASLGKFAPKKAYYIERNRLWLLLKTFPVSMILLSPWFTLLRYAYNIFSMLTGSGSAAGFRETNSSQVLALALIKASWDGLLGAPKMLMKRSTYPRRISTREMRALLWRYRISADDLTLQD